MNDNNNNGELQTNNEESSKYHERLTMLGINNEELQTDGNTAIEYYIQKPFTIGRTHQMQSNYCLYCIQMELTESWPIQYNIPKEDFENYRTVIVDAFDSKITPLKNFTVLNPGTRSGADETLKDIRELKEVARGMKRNWRN